MHGIVHKFSLRLTGIGRTADQRAAFGKFCLNAASFPLPERIGHRQHGGYQIHFIRRKFFGLVNLTMNALVEPLPGTAHDIWTAARALLQATADRRAADILKVFVAGSASPSAGQQAIDGYDAVFLPFTDPEAIEIADSYERFLSTLGRRTRRDMRRLRRTAQSAGFVFEFHKGLPPHSADRQALGRVAHPRPYSRQQIDAYDAFLAAQENAFYTTLRSASGELLSCCAGLLSDGAAVLLYQLNHRAYPKACLSLTNRSFTIERLIQERIQELLLPGGGSGLLMNFCRMRQSGELVLIKRSAAARAKARVIKLLRPDSAVALAAEQLFRSRRPG
jgi:hypothetical protein